MLGSALPILSLVFTSFLLAAPVFSQETSRVTAFKVDKLYPGSTEPIDRAVLVVEKDKVLAVGPEGKVKIPQGATIRDLPEAVIIPGLVDSHSHIGIYPRPHVPANGDGNEMSGPVQPGLRAIDSIDFNDPGIRMALAGGVTTANIMPGSGNVIGGQTVYVKLRGNTIEAMRITDPKNLGGLKMANGENPKGYGRKGQAPFTRMKVAALQREQFVKAREYQQKWTKYREAVKKGDKTDKPELDISMEPLVEVLEKRRTVHFHCHRADDVLTALRIAEEFGFEIVLQHGTEGYRVVDELVKKKIPVSLTLIDSPGGKAEVMGLIEEAGAILDKAGVLVAINTDDFITESRFLLRTGSIAIRGGMSELSALKALTINPAKMMHLDHRVGSLEPGKDADFVILSGAPFSAYTGVLETYIEGNRVFERAQKMDWRYQAGGFALPKVSSLPATPAPPKPLESVKAPDVPQRPGQGLAIVAGRIHTMSGKPILNGVILIKDGKIDSVGTRDNIKIPADMAILTVAEVTPGFIDAHSVCGLSGAWNIPADQDQDEASDPNQADLRVIDGFHPNEPLLEFLRSQGVTTIHTMPGRINVIAGQTGIFRTAGTTVDQMTVRFPAGLLVNLGETPKGSGKAPTTRMATAKLVRDAFTQAKNSIDKKGTRNLKHEALLPMLDGKVPVIFSAHRADDIVTALRLAEEFSLKPILSLATEAYLVPEPIEKAKVPVIVHPTMQRSGGSMETLHSFTGNAAFLSDRKVPVAICTAFEGYVPKTRMLRGEASMAMAHGMGHERALRAVTIDAAKILGLDKEYGSIEAGKVADLVLYDGDPLENATHVAYTVMNGRIVYDRGEYLKLPFARRAVFAGNSGGNWGGCCLGAW
jgi:imidazolonepropionase-like amidohydrolase